MEAKQSPRPRAASAERRLGWRPLWYAEGSEQRMNQRGSNVDNLRPELYRSWRKKDHRRTQIHENSTICVVKREKLHSSARTEMLIITQPKILDKAHRCGDGTGHLMEDKKDEGILGNIEHYDQFTYNTTASKRRMS